jgi:hypothetical protein
VYFQVYVDQRGAVRPLIRMLEARDPRLREMAAFALGRLAQVLISVALVLCFVFCLPLFGSFCGFLRKC